MPVQNNYYSGINTQGLALPTSSYGVNPDIAESGRWQLTTQAPQLANQRDIARMQTEGGITQAQIAAAASTLPAQLQMQRFNRAFPVFSHGLASYSPGGSAWTQMQQQSGQPGPHVTVGGIWNPQQIQSQVNQTRAQNDRSLATQNQQQAQQLSGRGFGSNSPLLAAVQGQNYAANLGTNTQAEQQIRWNAAQGNAQAITNTQQAAANVYAQRQQEDIQRRQQLFGVYNTLIGALSSTV